MLEELRIAGLGVIEDARLELAPGLTVLTGETGAGKTMVVSGLELLLGGRGDGGLVRTGSRQALVEGVFRVDPDGPVATRAADAGATVETGELIAGRTVAAAGRSRAQLGGRTVPVSLLGELADGLVARHGQADQLRLLKPGARREALDRFGGSEIEALLAEYSDRYQRHREVVARLAELTSRARERAQEADLLRHGLSEVAKAAPQPGEDAELEEALSRLTHADSLRTAAEAARAALSGTDDGDEPDALGLVAVARRALEQESAHDQVLAEIAGRLAEAGYLLGDVSADLASYAQGIDADPAALAAAQERRAVLAALTRRYGNDVSEVLAWVEAAGVRLADLETGDEQVEALTAQAEGLDRELDKLAGRLRAARIAAAERLGEAVTAELADLAMPHARLGVVVGEVARGPHGADEIEFTLTAHPGAPARPLARAASGGELSRVMLALEVVLAGDHPVPTFVFDEVDAGVGGRAAVEVGLRLARLARVAQVLVVTHLPQVAAYADRQYVVEKNHDGVVTASGVRLVDGEDRLAELARMLAGLDESELGRGHAEELLEAAAARTKA